MEKTDKQINKARWLTILLNRYYKYFIIFLCLAILFWAGFFWLKPKYQDVLKLSSENLPLRQEKLDELARYYNKLQGLKEELDGFQSKNLQNLEKLKKILPPEKELANMFAQLEALITYREKFELKSITFSEVNLTRQNGAKQDNENPAADNDFSGTNNSGIEKNIDQMPSIGAIDIGLSMSGGGYLDFKEILGDIEKHLRVLDIASINFGDIYVDPSKDETADYLITLRAYYAKN